MQIDHITAANVPGPVIIGYGGFVLVLDHIVSVRLAGREVLVLTVDGSVSSLSYDSATSAEVARDRIVEGITRWKLAAAGLLPGSATDMGEE